MEQLLISVASFILVIGVLVTVHEFGHFWVARRLGVGVVRFSIGFGKPLIKWNRGRTEYVIAAIPLGGYVKMIDEQEDDIDDEDLPYAFNRKPLWIRASVVAAGPLLNFLFAILAYWLMYMNGVQGLKPFLGAIEPETIAAAAGFQRGDEILAVGQKDIASWEELLVALMDSAVKGESVDVSVVSEESGLSMRKLDFSTAEGILKKTDLLKSVGVSVWRPEVPPEIAALTPSGPGELAGLMVGDKIIGIGEYAVTEWSELTRHVRENPGAFVDFTIERADQERILAVKLGEKGGRCDPAYGFLGASASVPAGFSEKMRMELSYSPGEALGRALSRTWEYSLLTLKMIGKMVLGQVSLENLSGPVAIAQYAGESSRLGFSALLGFMALISISLGVLNLLPIPLLDGGHLLYYLVESVTRKPLSDETQQLGQRIGIAVLMTLMLLALYNDLLRLIC